MKKYILLATILSTGSAFAISDQKLISTCSERSIEKMNQDARLKNCTLRPETLQAYFINNKIYNPSKFVGYHADMLCSHGLSNIFMIVQYDSFAKTCM